MKLLADNVLNQERALSFRENGNSLSLTSLFEKFGKWNENHSNDCMDLHFPSHKMIGDNLAY